MDWLVNIVIAIVTSGLVSTGFNWYIRNRELGDQRKWEIKREACLEALKIVDARFSHIEWINKDGAQTEIDRQEKVDIANIRSCFNRLVLSCEDSKVPKAFTKCLNLHIDNKDPGVLYLNDIAELRNAIRKELGFGEDLETDMVWIFNINWRD